MKILMFLLVFPAILFAGTEFPRPGQNPHGEIKWDCQDCHTADSWEKLRQDIKFDHTRTGFNLLGAHQKVLCASCHKDPVFNRVGTACLDCHTDHHQGRLGNDCSECHTTRDWGPQQELLMRHAERGFPLTGVHAVADCESCHRGHDRGEYVGTPTACEACHAGELARVEDPDHTQTAFQTDCQNCHHAAFGSWSRTTYEHPGTFPLTGAHLSIPCGACHTGGFTGTPTRCFDCHATEYAATDDPDHETGDFSTECQLCHTTTAWEPASFDHNTTGFTLMGAHQSLACIACHQTVYAGTPSTCIGCHQSDYDGTNDPDHAAAQFSTDCENCHSQTAWEPATFDHNTTGFSLLGAHQSLNCLACHQTVYAGTPSTCIGCHQSDYDGTTDPNHAAAQFPVDCEGCHTMNAWEPADWDHDGMYFPIYSGAHRDEWNTCGECHTISSDYSLFDCTACHEHNQTDMDDKHNEVNNYQYVSTACYTCHPQGGD